MKRKVETSEEENAFKRTKPSQAFVTDSIPAFSDEEDEPGAVSGLVYVLGQGDCGQLGKGEDFMEARVPSLSSLPGDPKATCVAAGGVHSLAIDTDCNVLSCGVNDEGALGRRTGNKIWDTAEARLRDSQEAGDDFEWGRVPIEASFGLPIRVSAGDSHSAILTDCGFIWGWGTFRDSGGVYGFQPDCQISLLPRIVYKPPSQTKVIQICSGLDHMLGLLDNGKVLSWGVGQQGRLGRIPKQYFKDCEKAMHRFKAARSEVENLKDKIESETDSSTRAQLEKDLQPLQQKLDTERKEYEPLEAALRKRQLTPTKISIPARIVSIACGHYNSFAIDDTGKVWSFGLDNYGQTSGAPPPPQEKDGEEHERFIFEPRIVKSLEAYKIAHVAGGEQHSLALTQTGRILSFGRTTYGRLGRLNEDFQSNVSKENPTFVDSLWDIRAESISAGEQVSACTTQEGKAFLWGAGTNMQLGNAGKNAGTRNIGLELKKADDDDSDELDELIPWRLDVSATKGKKIYQIEFGGQHTLLLRQD